MLNFSEAIESAPIASEVDGQAGTEGIEGQPDTGTDNTEGQPANMETSQTSGEPSGEEGLLGVGDISPDKLPDAYKNLQREFSKRSDEYKSVKDSLSAYEDQIKTLGFNKIDDLLNSAQYLVSNPNFQEFLKQEQQRQMLGNNYSPDDLDEDTQKALETVQNVATNVADRKIQEVIQQKVDPLVQKYQEQYFNGLFSQMDNDPLYGDIWRDYKDDMASLVEYMPSNKKDNIDINDLKGVFLHAVQRKGDTEKIMAKAYQKKLSTTKSNSVPKTGSVNKGMPAQYKTLTEAFEAALKTHNM